MPLENIAPENYYIILSTSMDVLVISVLTQLHHCLQNDRKEGMEAFLEKRAPVFTNS